MTYTPQEGSYAAKVISYLEQQPAGTWVSSRNISEIFGIPPKQVVGVLGYACAADVLVKKKVIGGVRFCLGPNHQSAAAMRLAAAELRDILAVEEVDMWPVQRAWRPAQGLPMPDTVAAPSVFHLGSML